MKAKREKFFDFWGPLVLRIERWDLFRDDTMRELGMRKREWVGERGEEERGRRKGEGKRTRREGERER